MLENGKYGHVAIVAEVSDTSVKIAQQNVYEDGFISDLAMSQLSNGKWQLAKNPLALLRKS